jgi:hypothetical protein
MIDVEHGIAAHRRHRALEQPNVVHPHGAGLLVGVDQHVVPAAGASCVRPMSGRVIVEPGLDGSIAFENEAYGKELAIMRPLHVLAGQGNLHRAGFEHRPTVGTGRAEAKLSEG